MEGLGREGGASEGANEGRTNAAGTKYLACIFCETREFDSLVRFLPLGDDSLLDSSESESEADP